MNGRWRSSHFRFQVVVCLLVLGSVACGPQGLEGEPTEGEAGDGAITAQLAGPPPRPTSLIAASSRARVDLSWPAVPGATHYRIQSGTSSGNYQWTWTSTTTSTTDWVDWGPLYWVVKAVNAYGESAASPEATATGWKNLSQGRPATQSTNYSPTLGLAGLAVDGYADGSWWNNSVSSTAWSNGHLPQWWRVDLGESKSVYALDIWNRLDCCSDELSNFDVYTSNDATTSPTNWTWRSYQAAQAGSPTSIDLTVIKARHVKIQRRTLDRAVMLAEVQVWGSPVDTTTPTRPSLELATALSSTSIRYTWDNSNDNVGVKQYIVQWCIGTTCTDFPYHVALTPDTTFVHTGLTPGTFYRYRVAAMDFAGNYSQFTNGYTKSTPRQ